MLSKIAQSGHTVQAQGSCQLNMFKTSEYFTYHFRHYNHEHFITTKELFSICTV